MTPRLRGLPVFEPGHVWLAGAGPGDPGLLTLHALNALAQADTVVHDALVDERVLALAQQGAERMFAGKRGGRPSAHQADITARLIALAREGRRVLRLKGGDPFVFGRGGEEVLTLAEHGIPFRIIPGITSGLAALTAAFIPATLRGANQALVFATGHGVSSDVPAPGDIQWDVLARLGQPIVLYMALAQIEAIARALIRGGLDPTTPAAVIAGATTPRQRVLVSTLGTLWGDARRERLQAPAVIVIGAIVSMRERLLALLPALEEAKSWAHAG